MKRKALRRMVVSNLLICLIFASATMAITGCHLGSPMNEPNNTPAGPVPPVVVAPPARQDNAPPQTAPLTVALTTDKPSYHRGDTVGFTISVHNNTEAPQTLQFRSGQFFDITARLAPQAQEDTPLAWRWSRGKMFTRDMPVRNIAAGATQTWTATWDQKGDDKAIVPRGAYLLEARITTLPPLPAAPIKISLED